MSTTFAAYSRICLTASTGKQLYVLLDGLITSVEVTPGTGSTPDTIVVTGDDVCAAMTIHEKSIPWPCMNDSAIVLAILAQYAVYGIIPIVIPTVFSASQGPTEVTQQQRGTDLDYINNRASMNGYIFRMVAGSTPGVNYAYFGPPLRTVQRFVSHVCPTLNGAPFPMGNVEGLKFTVNHNAAEQWGGVVLDVADQDSMLMPVASLPGLNLPPFATSPAALVNMPWVKFKLMEESTVDPIQAFAMLQGRANQAGERTVTVEGTVDVERYGGLLFSPGVVSIRGAGHHHDGKYMVSSVSSDITPEHFKQSFSLSREGMGSTIAAVPPVMS
jgi:hypothetical protein